MKLQFDANQPNQLDAIAAAVDPFDGQPQGAPLFSMILELRTEESDKVRCGEKHFEAIGVPFGVAVTAGDV
jgi:hypothetical protein